MTKVPHILRYYVGFIKAAREILMCCVLRIAAGIYMNAVAIPCATFQQHEHILGLRSYLRKGSNSFSNIT